MDPIKEETTTVFHATLSTRRISLLKRHDVGAVKLRITVPGVDEPDRWVEATIKTEEDLRKLEALVRACRLVLESKDYGERGAVDAALTKEALEEDELEFAARFQKDSER